MEEILAKIELIEQTLSGQYGESESLRVSYYNKKSQLNSTSSFQNKNCLKESLRFNHKYEMNKFMNKSLMGSRDYLQKCSSSSKDFFRKPKREYYVPPVRNLRKYEPNRQKMPQTSYNLQFPSHKGGVVLPSQEPFRVPLPETSLSVKNSTY